RWPSRSHPLWLLWEALGSSFSLFAHVLLFVELPRRALSACTSYVSVFRCFSRSVTANSISQIWVCSCATAEVAIILPPAKTSAAANTSRSAQTYLVVVDEGEEVLVVLGRQTRRRGVVEHLGRSEEGALGQL